MKLLIIVEGPNEETFYNALLDKNIFIFKKEDLIDRKIHFCRQLKSSPKLISDLERQQDKIDLYRFGDKLGDKLIIPSSIKSKINSKLDYNILPELEMLFVIQKGLYNSYQKVKTKTKVSSFAKSQVVHKKKKYNATSQWIADYVADLKRSQIINMFKDYSKKYKRNPRCKNDIFDLIKKK